MTVSSWIRWFKSICSRTKVLSKRPIGIYKDSKLIIKTNYLHLNSIRIKQTERLKASSIEIHMMLVF